MIFPLVSSTGLQYIFMNLAKVEPPNMSQTLTTVIFSCFSYKLINIFKLFVLYLGEIIHCNQQYPTKTTVDQAIGFIAATEMMSPITV